jgi:hypothetical protein
LTTIFDNKEKMVQEFEVFDEFEEMGMIKKLHESDFMVNFDLSFSVTFKFSFENLQ